MAKDMTRDMADMARFIHELRGRPVRLVDDGIDVSAVPPRTRAPLRGSGGLTATPAPTKNSRRSGSQKRGDARQQPAQSARQTARRAHPTQKGRRPRPHIVSYFIDYFVVFVTVASVYFGYLVFTGTARVEQTSLQDPALAFGQAAAFWSAFTELSSFELMRQGVIVLVCLSVLFVIYKLMHRLLAIPSLGERWRDGG